MVFFVFVFVFVSDRICFFSHTLHILLDCVDFSDQRPRFYSSPNLKHLFTQVPGHQILSFSKTIGLYGKF